MRGGPTFSEDSKRIRALFVTAGLGLGGGEKQLVDLVRNLDRAKIDPRVLVFRPGGERESTLRQAQVPLTILSGQGGYFRRFIERNWEIMKVIRSFVPHIIQTFDPITGFYCTIGGRLLRTPCVLSGISSSQLLPRRLFYGQKLLWPFMDKIVCNSEGGVKYLVERCKVPRDRLIVVPNGLDFHDMEIRYSSLPSLRLELGIKDQSLVGMIGKLNDDKDPMVFARAALIVHKSYPRAVFCIIGSGPDREMVQQFLIREGLANRFFLIPQRADAPWLVRDFDIGVLCSRAEGLPNVILEYMYWGKPSVVTDVGDCGRVVINGQTGLVVPSQDPESFASALLELLRNPQKAKRMGFAGRERLEANYRIERYVDDMFQLYSSMLKQS